EDRRLPDAACFRKLRQGVVQYLLRIFIDIVIYLQFRSGEVLLRLFQPDRRLHFILPKIQTNPPSHAQLSIASLNFFVISCGRVIALPTTTACEPSASARAAFSGVSMLPSAMTGTDTDCSMRSSVSSGTSPFE